MSGGSFGDGGIQLVNQEQISAKKETTAEKISWWNGILSFTGMSAFFSALKQLEAFAPAMSALMGGLGVTEVIGWGVSAWEAYRALSKYQLEKLEINFISATFLVSVDDNSKKEETKNRLFRALMLFLITTIANGTILAAIIASVIVTLATGAAATLAGCVAIATLAPILFIAGVGLKGLYSLGVGIWDTYQYVKAVSKANTSLEKEEASKKWASARENLLAATVCFVAVVAIAAVLVGAPFSFPAMAGIAAAVMLAYVGYKAGCRVYEKYAKKDNPNDEEMQLELDENGDLVFLNSLDTTNEHNPLTAQKAFASNVNNSLSIPSTIIEETPSQLLSNNENSSVKDALLTAHNESLTQNPDSISIAAMTSGAGFHSSSPGPITSTTGTTNQVENNFGIMAPRT